MLRGLLPVLCVACAQGATVSTDPAQCGEAECAARCAEADAKVVVPEGGTRLTAYEAERLTEARHAVQRGLSARGEWASLWCVGAGRCEQPLHPLKMIELAAGPYVITVPFRVPSEGAWTVTVDLRCTEGGPADQHQVLPVGPESGYATGPYVSLVVPPGWSGLCKSTITSPSGVTLGQATASFSTSPQPPALLTAAQLAFEPAVTAAPVPHDPSPAPEAPAPAAAGPATPPASAPTTGSPSP